MSFADWTEHPDSLHDFTEGRSSAVVPPVDAGVNAWQLTAALGANFRRIAYVNQLVRTVRGSQEVGAVFRLSSASPIRIGLIAMWDGLSLDSTDKAYVLELGAELGELPRVRFRNGPSNDGSVILGPSADLAFDHWYQLLLQLKFDQLYNLQVRVALSDADVESVATPNYSLLFEPHVIPKVEARNSGNFAFFVESRQNVSFTAHADQVGITTTLTDLG